MAKTKAKAPKTEKADAGHAQGGPNKKAPREGRISQVIGAVVDVEFGPGDQPELFEALEVTVEGRKIVLEVSSDIGDNVVRCIAMDATDGIRRGDPVHATAPPSRSLSALRPSDACSTWSATR